MAARVVAVTGLALQVLDDMLACRLPDAGSAEDALLTFLEDHRFALRAIHAAALKEMQALAPHLLATNPPGAGVRAPPPC